MNYSALHRYPSVVFEITLFFLFLFKQLILQFLYWQQSYLKSIYRLEIWRFVFSFHFLRFTRISSNLSTEILKPLFFRLVLFPFRIFLLFFCYLNSSSNFLILILIFHKIWKAKKNWFLLLILSDKKISFTLYGFRA